MCRVTQKCILGFVQPLRLRFESKLLIFPLTYTGDLLRYVLDRLFENLTDKSHWHIDDRNNVDMLRIITSMTKSKLQLTIGVFSMAFVMSVIEKLREFLNTPTMKYELRSKCWINTVVMIQSVPHCLLMIILLPEYYYVPIRKIKLCCWHLDLKWCSRFSSFVFPRLH